MIEVVLPVLDERDAIPRVLRTFPAGYEPIVVDNGSSDGSAEVARALGARVVAEPRRGFGAACYAGLLATRGPVVCFMDCDATLDPNELPLVADPVAHGALDLVLGRRDATTRHWPVHARLANRALGAVVRRRTGLELFDIGPMRAARRDQLVQLGLRDRRFGWPLEMVLRAAEAGWRIGQVDISYGARVGRSKVTGTVRGTARTVRDMVAVLHA